MGKKAFFLIIFFCISFFNIFSLDNTIHVSDLNINTNIGKVELDKINKYFFDEIETSKNDKIILEKLQTVVYKEWIVDSELSANQVCKLYNIENILYGFINININEITANIFLYNKSENSIILNVSYESNNTDHKIFMLNLSKKVNQDINTIFFRKTIEEEKKKKKKIYVRDHIGIYNAIGYWIPFPEYWEVFTGIICVETGIALVRLQLFKYEKIALLLRPDLVVSYSLGINKQGFAEGYFNSILIRSSIGLNLEIISRVGIILTTGIQGRIDMFSQKYLGEWTLYTSGAFSLMTSLDVEYWFLKDKQLGVGLKNTFDFAFYEDFMIDYRVMAYIIFRFKEKEQRQKFLEQGKYL